MKRKVIKGIIVVDRTGDKMGWTEADIIYVTGHSQGGNDAQVAVLCSEKYGALFDKCYSKNGEGHSPELLEYLKERYGEQEYNELLDIMYAVNQHDDPIHRFGSVVISDEHTITISNELGDHTNALADIIVKHGMSSIVSIFAAKKLGYKFSTNVINAHDIKGMFGTTVNGEFVYSGNINEVDASESVSVNVANSIWEKLEALPTEQRISCQVALLGVVEFLYGSENRVGLNGEAPTKKDLVVLKEVGVPLIVDALYDNLPEENQEDRESIKEGLDKILDIVYGAESAGELFIEVQKNMHVYCGPIIAY